MKRAFTLVELLVVLFVIGILAAIVLPSTVGLFTAGADAQAYNALAGQLAAARMLAIQQRTFAGVHAQLADVTGSFTKNMPIVCFTAVVQQDPNGNFILAEGFSPRKMPGSTAFGRVVLPFWIGSNYAPLAGNDERFRFTSLTFMFAPNGQLVNGKAITFDANPTGAFGNKSNRTYLWDKDVANHDDCKPSVKAAVMFNWDKLLKAPDKPDYLNKYGQIVVLNLYTGTLIGRQ
jgi:prepilin-type N-terminal cleavage/methylation domain-containing protein